MVYLLKKNNNIEPHCNTEYKHALNKKIRKKLNTRHQQQQQKATTQFSPLLPLTLRDKSGLILFHLTNKMLFN